MKENKGQMSPGTAQRTALTAPSSLPDLQLAQTGQGVFLSLPLNDLFRVSLEGTS